jgi:hypothetical protein
MRMCAIRHDPAGDRGCALPHHVCDDEGSSLRRKTVRQHPPES